MSMHPETKIWFRMSDGCLLRRPLPQPLVTVWQHESGTELFPPMGVFLAKELNLNHDWDSGTQLILCTSLLLLLQYFEYH